MKPPLFFRSLAIHGAAIAASAGLSALFLHSGHGWYLGFAAFVPWLIALRSVRTIAGAAASAYTMSLFYTGAVFAWLGAAIGSYAQAGPAAGLLVLLLAAPLFQPQFIAFAVVRHIALRRGPRVGVFAGAAAYVAAEWAFPRLLDDTISYGLYQSPLLRQAADIGGTAGLTFLLILTNEGIAATFAHRREGFRASARRLALTALIPLLLAVYGVFVFSTMRPEGQPLRVALIQTNIINYENERRQKGTYEFVRELLDTHFAMSHDAVKMQHADAVLWAETAYPTTFGNPRSEAGAELDREIQRFVDRAGVPFVIGTYERDADGEYNAAAFLEPGSGLLGFYRKTRLFPMTEYVPEWMDGPALRRLLPWTGNWRAGSGARVFPLRLADGREIPVLAAICLDDVDTGLLIDGARLGAQAIFTMSNDSWFTDYELGARMHHFVAAFRSIETRLPQYRVTSNGYSAVIDPAGSVVAGSEMGERALVTGDVPVGTPPRTLVVLLGDWVGRTGAAFLLLLGASALLRRVRSRSASELPTRMPPALPAKAAVLPRTARFAAGLLRTFARSSLLAMALLTLADPGLTGNTLAQIRLFVGFFLIPEAASWMILLFFAGRASIEGSDLILARRSGRYAIPLQSIDSVETWRLPLPGSGVTLRLSSGERLQVDLAVDNPAAIAQALEAYGCRLTNGTQAAAASLYANARAAIRRSRIEHPAVKFIVLSLVLALPAFCLHQNITFGSAVGEYLTFGLKAYLSAFAIWWAASGISIALLAALLRAAIESGTLLSVLFRPGRAIEVRRTLERTGLIVLYLGPAAWLLFKIFA